MPPMNHLLGSVNSLLWERPRVKVNMPTTEKSSLSFLSPSQGQKGPGMPLCTVRGCQECFFLHHLEAASGKTQWREKRPLPRIDLGREDTHIHTHICFGTETTPTSMGHH